MHYISQSSLKGKVMDWRAWKTINHIHAGINRAMEKINLYIIIVAITQDKRVYEPNTK